MKKDLNNTQTSDLIDFIAEHQKIVNFGERQIPLENRWLRTGDYFQKLSMYDDSYITVQGLGGTTLIK